MIRNIFKSVVVCAVASTVVIGTASAAVSIDSTPSKNTIICKSPAGYNMTVKGYYDYMKKFAGIKNTTDTYQEVYSDYGAENYYDVYYNTSCTVDSEGTLRVSVSQMADGSSYCKDWFGITIHSDYNFSVTNSGTEYYYSDDGTVNKYEFAYDYNSYINGFDNSYSYENGEPIALNALMDNNAADVCSCFGYGLSFIMNGFLWDTTDKYCEYYVDIPVIEVSFGQADGVCRYYDYVTVFKNSDQYEIDYWNIYFPESWNAMDREYRMSHV